ncbi:MAG: hypothetical protein IKL80_03970, partial [Clostridia bacterium]|nr:hypothetical protein [Clostridia bacterium]
FDDGLRMNFGIDCFRKLYHSGKLSEQGKKLMQKTLKNIVWAEEGLAKEKLLTEETDTQILYFSCHEPMFDKARCAYRIL